MLFYLFLLFTVVPIVELALLVWLGGQTVWWLPVLLVIADGLAGALLWRWQGLRTLVRIQEEMAARPHACRRDGRRPVDLLRRRTPHHARHAHRLRRLRAPDPADPRRRETLRQDSGSCTTSKSAPPPSTPTAAPADGASDRDTTSSESKIIDARVIETHVEDA